MKAILIVKNLLFNRSMELECSIRKDVSAGEELRRVANANSGRIAAELNLTYGEASLELVSYNRVIATGRLTGCAPDAGRPRVSIDKKAS